MVQELKIETPEPKLSWETQQQLLFEFAVEGLPLPEKMDDLLKERAGFLPSDRDPSAVKAEKAWDAYHLWLAANPEVEDLTPGERLQLYFSPQQDGR